MKVISQETFDSVVLEYVQDFEHSLPEAVEEATKEFEAQGVELSNIVKTLKLTDDNNKVVHDVLLVLQKLQQSNYTEEEVQNNLTYFTNQCKKTLAHRILATKHGAYDCLLKHIHDNQDTPDMLSPALSAMATLTDTNPDILTPDGISLMLQLINKYKSGAAAEVCEAIIRWCIECCLKHENNRQSLVEAGMMGALVSFMRSQKENPTLVKASCKAIRAFTLDDDIRIEFGKAHEHARLLVEEHNLIQECLKVIQGPLLEAELASEIMSTVSKLCVRAEYCQNAVDNGALKVINDVLVSFGENNNLNKQSINLLKTICGDDIVKEEVMKSGVVELVISTMNHHQKSLGVCEAVCGALSMLALRTEGNAKQLGEFGANDAVVQAMKLHPQEKQLQKIACMALRNLASKSPENRIILKERCQVEPVIHAAMKEFGEEIKDLAKAALRDLGLEVKLVEQWKGTGKEIDR